MRMNVRRAAISFLVVSGLTGLRAPAVRAADASRYLYQETRNLVQLVEDAADLVEVKGRAAFGEFSRKGSHWFDDTHYLFIYDLKGTCLFHPVERNLVGRSLIGLQDMNGKPVIRLITEVGKKPERQAAGWVFYLWEESTQFVPRWKTSYVRKAVGPDHAVYLVGCGVYNMKIEREFVRERVDAAANFLRDKGVDTAFREFRDPASEFSFLDTYIFVMDTQGHMLVDPAYPTGVERNLGDMRDANNRYFVREMLDKLRAADTVWVQYMWNRPDSYLPARKVIYARKLRRGGDTFIIGSDFLLLTPVWMKS